jgi:hypothetical protein
VQQVRLCPVPNLDPLERAQIHYSAALARMPGATSTVQFAAIDLFAKTFSITSSGTRSSGSWKNRA